MLTAVATLLAAIWLGSIILYGIAKVLEVLWDIAFELVSISASLTPVDGAESIDIFTIIDGKEQRLDKMNLKVTQMVPLIAKGKDKKKNDAEVENPVFSVDDETLATIVVGADGVPMLVPQGPLGAVTVKCDADGLIGDGVKPLHFEGAVNLVAGDAEVLDIQFGAPVDQP